MSRRRKEAPAQAGTWLDAAEALTSSAPAPGPTKPTVGVPVDPARVEPVEVRAYLAGRIALPSGPMSIDALLAAVVCLVAEIPPPSSAEDVHPVEIPVAREPGGRFHLASFSVGAFERFAPRWINRSFPLAEAQAMASPTLRRINISGGPCKSYRIPLEAGHVEGDVLRWYALGDPAAMLALLQHVEYLGKRRGVGLGRVLSWELERVKPWGSGFPVVDPEGKALRTLPLDWPGLVDPEEGWKVLSYPYWNRAAEEPCAVAARSV